jgi:hypothetical protein
MMMHGPANVKFAEKLLPFSSEVSYINLPVLKQFYFKQNMQFSYNVRLGLVRTTIVAVEKQ